MSTAAYQAKRDELTKKPRTLIVITLEFCSRTYNVAPCVAEIGVTGDVKCYNTRKLCQDPVNYEAVAGGKKYKFGLNSQPNPLPGETIRPYLVSEPSYETTEIDPFGVIKTFRNASARMSFYDEPDNDTGIDPYLSERVTVLGEFWRKWLARNFYNGRSIEIKRGFEDLAESDYVSAKYIIERIEGPVTGNTISIIAKDPLKKADKVKVPAATAGKLAGAIDDSVTSMTLDDSTEYPAPATVFYARIDNEIMKCTANNTGSGVITIDPSGRGALDTTAAAHSDGAKVQLCYYQENAAVWDIMDDILQNEVGIAAADIDVSGNQDEADTWLTPFVFTGVVSKPVTATQLLTELCQQSASYLFWSDDEQKIVLRAMKIPAFDSVSLNETEHLIAVEVDQNESSRVSRAIVYYDKDPIGDIKKSDSYSSIKIAADAIGEGPALFGEPVSFFVFSRWVNTDSIASRIANLTMRRFQTPAIKLSFGLELKDADVNVGQFLRIDTAKLLDENGQNVSGGFYQVLSKKRVSKSVIRFVVMDAKLNRRYWVISPAGTADYNSASDAEKATYGWIGSATNKVGTFAEDGYYIF